jgi:hypothetical protein
VEIVRDPRLSERLDPTCTEITCMAAG